jgi:hypothetical protein
MKLGWEFIGEDVQLTFKVSSRQCRTTGWCGVSFGREAADFIVIWFDHAPKGIDGFEVSHGSLQADAQQGGVDDLYVKST